MGPGTCVPWHVNAQNTLIERRSNGSGGHENDALANLGTAEASRNTAQIVRECYPCMPITSADPLGVVGVRWSSAAASFVILIYTSRHSLKNLQKLLYV